MKDLKIDCQNMACNVLELCLIAKKMKDLKVYCQNMACGAFELCFIAAKIEGFKSLLPKYGIRRTWIMLNCNTNWRI